MNSVSRKYVLRAEAVFGKCASESVSWITDLCSDIG